MKLIYKLGDAGWADASIADEGAQLECRISYLSDALGDMAQAAVQLLNGARATSFSFQDEPGEHRFLLTRGEADRLDIRVLSFKETFAPQSAHAEKQASVVFRSHCAVMDFVGQVSANLHDILTKFGLKGYKDAWTKDDFPMASYREIQRHLNPVSDRK